MFFFKIFSEWMQNRSDNYSQNNLSNSLQFSLTEVPAINLFFIFIFRVELFYTVGTQAVAEFRFAVIHNVALNLFPIA